MRIKKCIACGRPAFPLTPVERGTGKWLCPACDRKIKEMDFKNPVKKPDYCVKCKKRTAGECPFTAWERRRIVRCNHWIGRDFERNKRRFARIDNYEEYED